MSSGTYYLRARYYQPSTSRFLTEDPIRDGLNWYAYANNNPIYFSDPWGLFGWNEKDDHVFNIQKEVEDAGGTFSFNRNTSTITIGIYGVTAKFGSGDWYYAGSNRTSNDSQLRMTAATFYSGVINAAVEMIFVGAHVVNIPDNNGVQTSFHHSSVIMFISDNSSYWGTKHFKGNVRWGMQYATLSAESWGGGRNPSLFGTLDAVYNRDADIDLSTKVSMQHVHSGAGRVSGIFSSFNYYYSHSNGCVPYASLMIPFPFVPEYNSNSFTSGLLRAAGFKYKDIKLGVTVPGFSRPVPERYFGYGVGAML